MSLNTEWQVVESAGVRDISRHDAAWQVRDLVSERVPDAATLLGLSISRRLNDVAFLDQRVEINHLEVVVEEFDGRLARHIGWQRADVGEDGSLKHDGRWL
jgi:hypothetical protein